MQWKLWEDAIINYTKTNKSQPKELRDALEQEMLLTKVHVLVKHKILFINHFKLNVDINNLHYFLATKLRKKQIREDVSNYCILPLILMQAPVSDS